MPSTEHDTQNMVPGTEDVAPLQNLRGMWDPIPPLRKGLLSQRVRVRKSCAIEPFLRVLSFIRIWFLTLVSSASNLEGACLLESNHKWFPRWGAGYSFYSEHFFVWCLVSVSCSLKMQTKEDTIVSVGKCILGSDESVAHKLSDDNLQSPEPPSHILRAFIHCLCINEQWAISLLKD